MISRVLNLYRHLLRRHPATHEDPLDHKITTIRVPLSPIEYVEAFGVDYTGAACKVARDADGDDEIVPLDESDYQTTFEGNESSAVFSPSEGSGAGGEGGS